MPAAPLLLKCPRTNRPLFAKPILAGCHSPRRVLIQKSPRPPTLVQGMHQLADPSSPCPPCLRGKCLNVSTSALCESPQRRQRCGYCDRCGCAEPASSLLLCLAIAAIVYCLPARASLRAERNAQMNRTPVPYKI